METCILKMLTIYSLKCNVDFVNEILNCFTYVRNLAKSKEKMLVEHLLERAIHLYFEGVL